MEELSSYKNRKFMAFLNSCMLYEFLEFARKQIYDILIILRNIKVQFKAKYHFLLFDRNP